MKLDLYWDETGDPRARAAGKEATLARFLESDVQGSAATGREILAALRQVEAGELPVWEQTGNAFTLRLSPSGAEIQSALDESDESGQAGEIAAIPLRDLRRALRAWVGFLGKGRS
jgi:hypothetical protein